jgi:hypothetical protein
MKNPVNIRIQKKNVLQRVQMDYISLSGSDILEVMIPIMIGCGLQGSY